MKRYFVRAAFIAAVYAVVTIALAPISYGPIQVRVADALLLLPMVFPEAIPGLVLGCLLANIGGGLGLWDIGLGSLANLLAGLAVRRSRRLWVAATCAMGIPAVVVGTYLSVLFRLPWLVTVAYLAVGEGVAVVGLGVPFMRLLAHREARTSGDRAHANPGDRRCPVQPPKGSSPG